MRGNGGGSATAWTVRALRTGQVVAAALFGAAIALHLVGQASVGAVAASAAVVVVLATPAFALFAAMVDARDSGHATALLAGAVLAVLSVATALAVFIGR